MLVRIIILLASLSALNCDYIPDPIVQIYNGKLRGRDHGNYLSFESIPYAEPPIGANRFEAPKAYSAQWSDVRDATQAPVKCIQWDQFVFKEDLLVGSEDCLTVNVYTPSITGQETYPVLVLIHGGAFMMGTAATNSHDYIMKSGKLVVVKITYRLGPLGFLSTEDEVIPGNLGLKDQLLALKWVKANVAAFNGNPAKITLIGFSAGAASVHLQMLNKNLESLVTSAISFSGTALCPWVITPEPRKRAVALAEYLSCPTESSAVIKSCLQQREAADIVRAVKHFHNFGYNPFTVFGPVIEPSGLQDTFLNEDPSIIISEGNSAQIPWLASHVKDDGGYNTAELMQKDANGRELIEVLNERWNELAPVNLFYEYRERNHLEEYSYNLKQQYMGQANFSAQNYRLLQRLYTDVLFARGVQSALKLHKQVARTPVYGYVYDIPSAFGLGQILSHRNDIEFGTVHGDDFYLLFPSIGVSKEWLSESERVLSNHFVKMVEDFSITGSLHFGTCDFVANNPSTNGLVVMEITKDYCQAVSL